MSNQVKAIVSNSLTSAWEYTVKSLLSIASGEIAMLCVSIEGFSKRIPEEDAEKRSLIDLFLANHGFRSIHTTANTIFPKSLWNEALPPEVLYERYLKILPKLRKHSNNHYGLYFERMVAFGYVQKQKSSNKKPINQLSKIIDFYRSGNHRRSALQVAILDPYKDLVNQRQRGFPCLQQVSFAPHGSKGWSVTGYYPHQYIVDRGYGNYLGLAYLGDFVAQSVGRKLTQVNCVASIASLGKSVKKVDVKDLVARLQSVETK